MYRMVFIAPTPNKTHAVPGAWVLQPSTVVEPLDLPAEGLDDARAQAAGIWAAMPHRRFMDPDGYWIVDATAPTSDRDGSQGIDAGRVVFHDERDEAMTPRAPADLERIVEFKRAMIAAGGGLVLVEKFEEAPEPAIADMLDDADLTYDRDDFITMDRLAVNDRQRAAIALHPIARDAAQLEHAIVFMAGGIKADRGTVADLQHAWLVAANNLAAMAQAGLLISTTAASHLVMHAA